MYILKYSIGIWELGELDACAYSGSLWKVMKNFLILIYLFIGEYLLDPASVYIFRIQF